MAPVRQISAAVAVIAVPFIAGFEGLYTKAYYDPVGIPTICFGHIEDVKMGDHMTKEECKQLLLEDLPRYEAGVQRCIKVPMTNKRHAAVLSLTYNVGEGALCKSSIARLLNAGDVQGGCNAFLLYNRAGGRVLNGLTRRREAERELCLAADEMEIRQPAPVATTPERKVMLATPAPPTPVEVPLSWVERVWYKITGRNSA